MILPGLFCAVLAMPGEHCKGSWPKWSHSALFPHCSSPVSQPRHVFMEVAKGSSRRAQPHKPLSSLRASADQHCPEASHVAKHRVERHFRVKWQKGSLQGGVKNWGSKCNQSASPCCVLSGSCTCLPVKRKREKLKRSQIGICLDQVFLIRTALSRRLF